MGFIKTSYQVTVAGQDVTARFDPYLLDLKVTRASGETADDCTMSLQDADGAIVMPSKRSPVLVKINGARVFSGFVADISYDFGSEGRTLEISASSADHGSKIKEPKSAHVDDASFEDVAAKWGDKVGLKVKVAGSIKTVKREYWGTINESFMAWGQRIANEIGASFKILGNEAYFVGISEGLSAKGEPLPSIKAQFGVNLLGGTISPIISRPKFANVKLSYFDIAKGERVETEVKTGSPDVDASLRTVITHADEDQAKQRGKSLGKASDREKGAGSVKILGEVYAEPEANCMVSGVRPGIDGTYLISSISHSVSRSGFVTDLTLKEPKDGAGVDKR